MLEYRQGDSRKCWRHFRTVSEGFRMNGYSLKLHCETINFFSLRLNSSNYSLWANCRGFLLQLISLNVTHTLGRGPLDEGSTRHRNFYMEKHNNHPRQTSIPREIRNRTPSKRAAKEPHLRPRGHRDHLKKILTIYLYFLLIFNYSR